MSDPIPKELYKLLQCPSCKGKLRYSDDKKRLVCQECGKKFPIVNNVAVLS